MAYTRGDYYLWSDDSRVHIWVRDGYDGWDDSVWNEGSGGGKGEVQPSGVAVPLQVADEFVVMRVAQLIESRQLTDVVTRTVEKWEGNGGCCALTQLGARLKQLDSEAEA